MKTDTVKTQMEQRLLTTQHNTIRRLQKEAVCLRDELDKGCKVLSNQSAELESLYAEIDKLDQIRNRLRRKLFRYHKLYHTWRRMYIKLLTTTINKEATHGLKS